MQNKSKCVLVTPLDWGLGHATRCIPIINQLLEENCTLIIAGSGPSLELLRLEFPMLRYVELPGYNPIYSAGGYMAWSMAFQAAKFIRAIKKEHQAVQRIVKENNITVIISDNRYGCWSAKTKNIFITHQINIIMPSGLGWIDNVVNIFNHRLIKNFQQCWVPDWPGENNLSGKLSEAGTIPVNYIGTLSRFTASTTTKKKYDILILLSGPEPQRSLVEKIVFSQVQKVDLKIIMVRGVQKGFDTFFSGNLEVVNFLLADDLQQVMQQSEVVIARSGYSTIMDLAKLGKKAIFIPTPGQTEQLYLARRLKERGIAYFAEQNKFRLTSALKLAENYSGFRDFNFNDNQIKNSIRQLFV